MKNISGPRSFLDKLKNTFKKGSVSDYIDDIEEILIEADIGLQAVGEVIDCLKENRIKTFEEAKDLLKQEFIKRLKGTSGGDSDKKPHIVLLVGVNGTGKTTTAAKLAAFYKNKGKKVVFAAADTFRAAATEQLESWAEKTGVAIIKGMEGADPASVVFDAAAKAKKTGCDSLIIDTAGRLHTKQNLMQELEKIKRVVLKEFPEENTDTYLTVDANTGKNAFMQAENFNKSLGLTGVILTKFDSSAKGGSIIQITSGLDLPIKYITFGESENDIEVFNPESFVEQLFD